MKNVDVQSYRNNLKSRGFDKVAPQNFDSERAIIAERQVASENRNVQVKPTPSKTDFSGCFGIKRLFLILLLIACKGFSSEVKTYEERIEFLEKKYGIEYTHGKYQAFVKGEALVWKADVDGVAYATTFISEQESDFQPAFNQMKTRTPHFAYDPGFRVGLGLQSPDRLFDFFLIWTRFYTKGTDEARGSLIPISAANGDKIILGLIGLIQPLVSVANKALMDCHIKENLLDMQMARGIQVSPHFFMRPYFGIRGVWSAIDWNIRFKRSFILPLNVNQSATQLKVKNDFGAVGGLIGLELDWKAPLGFGVSIHSAGALVWGKNEEATQQKYLFVLAGATSADKEKFKAHNSAFCLKGMWELFVGGFWETNFQSRKVNESSVLHPKQSRVSLRLVAGYEFQQWPYFGQKTFVQSTRERERFNLSFQGFTGGAKLVF